MVTTANKKKEHLLLEASNDCASIGPMKENIPWGSSRYHANPPPQNVVSFCPNILFDHLDIAERSCITPRGIGKIMYGFSKGKNQFISYNLKFVCMNIFCFCFFFWLIF